MSFRFYNDTKGGSYGKSIIHRQFKKKSYNGKTVLDIDHLTLPKGAIYGLIGPNGAGKSTLMKSILGLISKDSGEMTLFDQKVTTKNQKILNRKLGALIERPSYYDHLTGVENLSILCTLKGIDKNILYRHCNQSVLRKRSRQG